MHSQTHVCPVAFLESSTQITPSRTRPSRLIALKSAPLGPSSVLFLVHVRAPRLDSLRNLFMNDNFADCVTCRVQSDQLRRRTCDLSVGAERDEARKRSGRGGKAGATIKEELAGRTRASDLKAAEFTETAACYFLNAAIYTEAHYINMFCLWTALDKFPLMESRSPSVPECLCVWCECFFPNMPKAMRGLLHNDGAQ